MSVRAGDALKGHEEYKQLLADAALDAASGEARALEAHLSSCAECRAELRELRDAAALVALASDPAAPSPELRSRLLDTIRRTPQESPASAGGATTSRVGPGAT
ncbi:MAG: hypothetical protein M3268_04275, partial [Acidobacteriota bacterium]|nr:hypothetical protein [Acidobacteriota bacterium]